MPHAPGGVGQAPQRGAESRCGASGGTLFRGQCPSVGSRERCPRCPPTECRACRLARLRPLLGQRRPIWWGLDGLCGHPKGPMVGVGWGEEGGASREGVASGVKTHPPLSNVPQRGGGGGGLWRQLTALQGIVVVVCDTFVSKRTLGRRAWGRGALRLSPVPPSANAICLPLLFSFAVSRTRCAARHASPVFRLQGFGGRHQ